MTWTHTSRGRALDLLAPRVEDVDLHEIGRALAQTCRYSGCTLRYYSTAEHSLLMAEWLLEESGSVDLALAGLLHDAAEAYMGDLTWPMQQALWGASPVARGVYREIQSRLDRVICELADLDPEWLQDSRVKTADLRILLDERERLLGPSPRPWPIESEMGLAPLGVRISCLQPLAAMARWILLLDRYQRRRGRPGVL